jgi:hypothetical protein
LRRIAVIATALLVLGAAGVAYAASQTYTAKMTFTTKKAGTKKKPVAIGYKLTLQYTGTASTPRPPVQLDIKTKIYGLQLNGKNFPTCSVTKIDNARNDNVCPKGALVGSGYIHSTLGAATNFNVAGFECSPLLDVWNAGQGKQAFFFRTGPGHTCGNLQTGDTPAYPGTYKTQGKYLMTNVPVPHDIDYPVAGIVGSLQYEQLTYKSQTKKVHGKKVLSQESVGCLKHKRPYSVTTVTTGGSAGSAKKTETVSHSAPC